MEGDIQWHHGQTLAAGQVAEFKVWAELMRQSAGGLHVFLPLRDVGIDAVLHRLADQTYIPVQVKGRMSLTESGQVHITVTASSLVDDDALIIGTLVNGADLGAFVLVIAEGDFRRLAAHDVAGGREYLTAAFELHANGGSRWAPYLVARERLAERFGVAMTEAQLSAPTMLNRAQEGFIGEAEVIRRLAEIEDLALFRPFPDLETVEVLVWNRSGHGFLGVQVKTSGFDASHREERVYIRASSFRPAASTYVCVLSWDRAVSQFAGDCLLIPSVSISSLARVDGDWVVLELAPGGTHHRRLDRFRVPLRQLGSFIASKLSC